MTNPEVAYGQSTLEVGIRSRFVETTNGLTMHVLEAGFERADRPCVVLLHGFPELAYSWRRLMLPLAHAGFHVVAPDQRGYGRSAAGPCAFDDAIAPYRLLNLVEDIVALVAALGRPSVAAVVGHDFGSPVAAYCALTRPDVFGSVVLMSAPFAGPPAPPSGAADDVARRSIHDELAALSRPRKHYQWYFSSRDADADMRRCPQGIHALLRAYYHFKSADWKPNVPFPLRAWCATELAKLPGYYVMDRDKGMAQTIAAAMPGPNEIARCAWLPDTELSVYAAEYARTGFQGGLNWYRCATDPAHTLELQALWGRTIDVPACFIAGASDWGIHQRPGHLARMKASACTDLRGAHLVSGAGHWVQQEQAAIVVRRVLAFLRSAA